MSKSLRCAHCAESSARLSGSLIGACTFTVVLAAFVTASGCGSGVQHLHVYGHVSLNGKPIEEGSIAFTPIKGTTGAATGGVIRNGQYDVAEAVGPLAGGTYRVQIESLVYRGRNMRDPMRPQGPAIKLPDNTVPSKYNAESVLEITFTADAKEKREDFELKSDTSQERGR